MALTRDEIRARQVQAGKDRWKNVDSVSLAQEMSRIRKIGVAKLTKEERTEMMRVLAKKRWAKVIHRDV